MYIIVAFWLFVAKQPKKVFNTYKQAVLQLPMFGETIMVHSLEKKA